MECVISACKWRVKPSAGKHETKPSNIVSSLWCDKGRAGFSNKRSQTIHPPPPSSDFADAIETSKKTENKEKETGSVLFSPQPATRWFGCRPWKMKQKCTVGGEAGSRQPLARSYLMTPGPSAAPLKAMAVANQRHAAMQRASVMSLLLYSMCLLQFFFFPPFRKIISPHVSTVLKLPLPWHQSHNILKR